MKYSPLILLAFCCVCSCRLDKNSNGNAGDYLTINYDSAKYQTIQVDLDKRLKPLELSGLFNIEMLMLEINSEALIGSIDKVYLTQNYIFVLDSDVAQKLFLFNRKGKYIRTIGKLGKGPGEYMEIADFDISEAEQKVFLYADDDRKIIAYDYDGKLLNETKISAYGYAINRFEDGRFLTIGWGSTYNVNYWDKKGKELSFYKDVNYNFINHQDRRPVSKYNDSCYIHFPFNNFIYKATSQTIEPLYYFDFKRNYPIHSITNKSQFKKCVNSGDYVRLGPCVVTGNTLWFDVFDHDIIKSCIYIKDINEVIVAKYLTTYGIPTGELVGCSPSEIIISGEPSQLIDYINFYKSRGTVKKKPAGLEKLTIDSNPYLIILSSKQEESFDKKIK